MHREEILSKGTYVHPQISDLVSVKQYVVTRIKEKKVLFVRLNNDRADGLDAVSLQVRQYDVKGELIDVKKVSAKKLNVSPLSTFALKTPIVLSEGCTEFRIDVASASYGNYTYDVIDGEAHIRYKKQKTESKRKVNTAALMNDMGGRKHSVSNKSLKAPALLAVICSVVLMIFMCASMIQIARYMYVQTEFSLEDFDYEFITDNKDNGPIRIIKYRGSALNLEIPAEVEGYPIGAIAKDAFSKSTLRNITVEGNVVIEDRAFENFSKLQSVTLPNVEEVGSYAFSGCENLKSAELGGTLKSIGERSFNGCGRLSALSLPDGLKSVGKYAFSECNKLSSLVIPSTVEFIGEGIVSETKISSLTVPFIGISLEDGRDVAYFYGNNGNENISDSLTKITVTEQDEIPTDTFSNCAYLKTIEFANPVTLIGDRAFLGCNALESFKMTEALTDIGFNAFKYCRSLKSIEIPKSITEIKEGTFFECSKLISVTIPDSVISIGNDAFKNCWSLEAVEVPNTVTYIGDGAFYDCASLRSVTIPFVGNTIDENTAMTDIFGEDGIGNIRFLKVTQPHLILDGCFKNMVSLEEVHLGNTVTEIGSSAFENCIALNKIIIPVKVTSIGDRAFFGCASLKTVNIPEGIEVIEDSLFEGCTSLTYVGIPESAVSINDNAFAGCALLDEVILPVSVTAIGQGAFSGCVSLGSISLPDGIEEVRPNTFEGCEGLSIVAIPTGVGAIGDRAFADCSSLLGISLPNTLNTLGSEAFANCSALTTFNMPASVNMLGSGILSGCTSMNSLSTHIMSESQYESDESANIGYLFSDSHSNEAVPVSLSTVTLVGFTAVPEGAFEGCGYLKVVNLPVSLTEIKANAFSGCGAISRVFLPDGVEQIGDGAFRDCASLSMISFSKQLNSIGEYAFSGCASLLGVGFGSNVDSIGDYAFEGCSSITSIELPESIEYLGYGCFYDCAGLESISVAFVGATADGSERFLHLFADEAPEALESITVTGEDILVDGAFCDVWSVKEIILNEEITSIGSFAFNGCYSLESLIIPENTEYIGSGAFLGCSSLNTLTVPFVGNEATDEKGMNEMFFYDIPESLKKVVITNSLQIPGNAFYGISTIEEVVIDCELIDIGESAFAQCRSLKRIEIPDTVQTIGSSAFSDCINVNRITIPRDIQQIGDFAFGNCFKLYEVYNNSENYLAIAGESQNMELDNGDVGYFAIRVYVGGEEQEMTETDGFRFAQGQYSGKWYLIDYNLNDGVCELPSSFEYEEELVDEYYLPANLFRENTDIVSIQMPYAVKGMGEYVFYQCASLTGADMLSSEIDLVTDSAFAECSALVSVSLPSTVTHIAQSAFNDCLNLSDVTLSYGLIGIGDWAFAGCLSLDRLILPNSVALIGNGAFYGCEELKRFEMSEAVMDIGDKAFEGCCSLNSIRIYENLYTIGVDAFFGCTSLYEVYNFSYLPLTIASADNGYIAYYAYIVHGDTADEPLTDVTVGDLLFKKSDNNWFLCGHQSESGELSLEPFVYEGQLVDSYTIVRYAFNSCGTITSLKITDAVKLIGVDAFSSQYGSIESIDLSENRTLSINDVSWIANLWNLKDIAFQPTLTELPLGLIRGFGNLQSLSFAGNENITYVPESAFSEINTLKTVVLPDSTENIGASAFYNCYALENITLPSSVAYIGDYSFYNCDGITNIELPSSCTEIGAYAFYSCNGLEAVDFSRDIREMGVGAFEYCSSLRTADLGDLDDLVKIPLNAFSYCSSLETVIFSEGLKTINSYAFQYCTALKTVEFPSTLKTIESYAFYDCSSIESITLPEGFETIYSRAFQNCTALKDIDFPSTLETIESYAFYNCSSIESIFLPEGLKSLGSYSFGSCSNLNNVKFPSTLKTIENHAFYYCSSLENITFSEGLETIYSCAFQNCTALKDIDFPSTLKTIESNAFYNCTSLEMLLLSEGLENLGSEAFRCCNKLIDVVFPSTLKTIGSYAFYDCSSLETITFSEGLETIDSCAFQNCDSLVTVDLPSTLTTIGDSAFYNCAALTEVNFSGAINYIGSYAFAYCGALESADLSELYSLRDISDGVFYECSALKELLLPERLERIYGQAFYSCTALEPVVIPSTVRYIGSYAFYNCKNLYEIWNLSDNISLTLGSSGNGYVAAYAVAIHNRIDEDLALHYSEINVNGVTYGFYRNTEKSYLTYVSNLPDGSMLILPSTEAFEYTVSRFVTSQGLNVSSIFVPYKVEFFEQGFISYVGSIPFYYEGNADEWNLRFSSLNGYVNLYTYEECKHYHTNTWMYDDSGNITTDVCDTYEDITEATCTEYGVINHRCVKCSEILSSESIDLEEHKYDDQHKCTECGRERTEAEKIAFLYMTFDSEYTFVLGDEGKFVSNNNSCGNTSAVATFTSDGKMKLTLTYAVSSESNYDFLYIMHNGEEIVKRSGSGAAPTQLELELEEGDTLTFVYSKDGSVNNGDDCATVEITSIEYVIEEPDVPDEEPDEPTEAPEEDDVTP